MKQNQTRSLPVIVCQWLPDFYWSSSKDTHTSLPLNLPDENQKRNESSEAHSLGIAREKFHYEHGIPTLLLKQIIEAACLNLIYEISGLLNLFESVKSTSIKQP